MKRRAMLNRGWQLTAGVAVGSLLPGYDHLLSHPRPDPVIGGPLPEPDAVRLQTEAPLTGNHHFFLVPALCWPYFQVQWGAKPYLGESCCVRSTHTWSDFWRVERVGFHPDRLELTMHPFDPWKGQRRIITLPGPLHLCQVTPAPNHFRNGYGYLEFQHPDEIPERPSGDYLASPDCYDWVQSTVMGHMHHGEPLPGPWQTSARGAGARSEGADG